MMVAAFVMGLVGGVAASAHCVGMCGGFALHLARASQRAPVLVRQLLYVAGKTFTYAFLGGLAGALGSAVLARSPLPVSQNALAVGAGSVIILFGLGMLGVKFPPVLRWTRAHEWGFLRWAYSSFFASPGASSSLLLGVATGFLPCPVTLAMLAAVSASGSPAHGMVALAGMGLGTAPALLGVGLAGSLVDARWRRIGLRPAGAVAVILGVITILRTQPFMHAGCHAHDSDAAAPCCATDRRPATTPRARPPAHDRH